MRRPALAILALTLLSSCSLLRRGPSREHSVAATGFDKKAAAESSVPGVTPEMASRYGCTWRQVETNWTRRRMAAARAGDPLCNVLGRYGQPFSVSLRRVSDMQLLSLQYRPNGRYVNLIAVQYDDTPVNRRLKRPVGTWAIQSYSNR